jgi:hypothetical protein
VWSNEVTLFKNTTPPLKNRGFFVVRKDSMSGVLKREYAVAEMTQIARLAGKDVSELSQSSAAELQALYDIPAVMMAYGYDDYLSVVASIQFYRKPRQ